MIKTQKLVPSVYYDRSRDFQLLGRVYDVVFNYLKNNENAIGNMSRNVIPDDRLVNLLITKLGFTKKHDYDNEQLASLSSIYVEMIRGKGTLSSIQLLLDLICCIEGSTQIPYVEYDTENIYKLNIFIPTDITDTNLCIDLLDYILPAGLVYDIRHTTYEKYGQKSEINLDVNYDITAAAIKNTVEGKLVKSPLDTTTVKPQPHHVITDEGKVEFVPAKAGNKVIAGPLSKDSAKLNDNKESEENN